jgi:alkyl hydroperoxide reductase subunit AhpC
MLYQHKYLTELTQMQNNFAERGTNVVAVSMDTLKRAGQSVEDWELGDLPVGHSLTEEQARAWDLYLSESIKDAEPDLFSEPGLFLIEPDGTLFYVGINSMPFGRPHLPAMLKAIDFVLEEDYPARGEVPVAQPVL